MSDSKPSFKAELIAGVLTISETPDGVLNRIGWQGLSYTKLEACEQLKKDIMERFLEDMNRIDWQAQQFIKEL